MQFAPYSFENSKVKFACVYMYLLRVQLLGQLCVVALLCNLCSSDANLWPGIVREMVGRRIVFRLHHKL